MTRNEERVLSFVQRGPMTLMALAAATGMQTGTLASTLTDLRRRGEAVYEGGKWKAVTK